tara:strand:+ start:80 stop:1096 length:1017 start_codon:yes stop_codon:yes gene_type:complete
MLTGCSTIGSLFGDGGYFRNRSNDYQKSAEDTRIQVPDGLNNQALKDIYVIPPVSNESTLDGTFKVPRPSPLVTSESEQAVKIQKLGEERWILAALAPGELWPQLRGYLSAKGIPIARVDARQGIMETVWLELKEGDLKTRYRFSIDEGVQRDTSELHVIHMLQTPEAGQVWPKVSMDIELEADILTDVANFIANRTEMASVSMVAQQAISASGKVTLKESLEGKPYIQLRLPYYRAWASLGQALTKADFDVKDLDRSAGQYYVSYIEKTSGENAEETGWFSWFYNNKKQIILPKNYLITVNAVDEQKVSINIDSESDIPLTKSEIEKLLVIVKGNLS